MSQRVYVKAMVMEYLTSRPGQVVYLKDIMPDLPEGAREDSVREVFTRAMREGNPATIEVVIRGQAWRYLPGPPSTKRKGKRMFEEVGEAKSGAMILECEDGTLWKAEQL
jgi:hypothetical protein